MKVSTRNLVINIPFFSGLILNVIVIKIFSKTVISPFSILLLYLIPGLVLYFFIDKFINLRLSKFLKLVYTTISFGSLFTISLLLINLNFQESTNSKTIKTKILKKGYTTKGNRPTADVEVDGIIKGFVFQRQENIDNYSSLELKLYDGVIGWKIIKAIELKK